MSKKKATKKPRNVKIPRSIAKLSDEDLVALLVERGFVFKRPRNDQLYSGDYVEMRALYGLLMYVPQDSSFCPIVKELQKRRRAKGDKK